VGAPGRHGHRCGLSSAATAAARDIAARAGLSATFLDSDVDAALSVCRREFDIVYTSIGVLPWLPDLTRWAQVVAGLLRPGGLFYLRDAHPILNGMQYDRTDGALVLTGPYFPTEVPVRYEDGTTYADADARLANAVTYEWPHSMAEIVQSLLDAGLVLTSLAEHRAIPWQALPQLVATPHGYVLSDQPDRLPLTFSLTATKPS